MEEEKVVDINEQKKKETERIMEEASVNRDDYWDKNNPFVKLVLLILGIIIIAGVVYYVMGYYG